MISCAAGEPGGSAGAAEFKGKINLSPFWNNVLPAFPRFGRWYTIPPLDALGALGMPPDYRRAGARPGKKQPQSGKAPDPNGTDPSRAAAHRGVLGRGFSRGEPEACVADERV